MRRVTVNKIASIAQRLALRKQVVLGPDIPAQTGTVVVGRVLTSKTTYNKLEDITGRMTELRPGDLIVGAFGLPFGIVGKMDESTTRSPFTPWTRPLPSTTADASPLAPILQVPHG